MDSFDSCRTAFPIAVGIGLILLLVGPAAAQFGGFGPQVDDEIDPDTVVLDVQVDADGTAEWGIENRYALTDENRTAAFADLAAGIAANETAYLDRFTERLESTIAVAADTTDREMRLENVTVSADTRSLPQREFGVVEYRFRWTNFAAIDGNRLLVGDALPGFFLDERIRLVVAFPDGYTLDTINPEPDDRQDRAVTWIGPTEFGPDGPTAVAVSDAGSAVPLAFVVVGIAAVAVLAGAALYVYRRPTDAEPSRESSTTTDGSETSETDADTTPPDELLSNEEQVLRLVEKNGGRIKQQTVVEKLGWTDAKTGQVVRELREADQLESFRLGRENVLRLPGKDDDLGP